MHAATHTLRLLSGSAALVCGTALAQLPPVPVSPAPVVKLEYDAQGNPTKTVLAPSLPGQPGLDLSTASSYDRLSRRKDTTDARAKTTLFEYNGREDLTKVTDPRNLITQYPRNGLGDATSLISPDTGTAVNTYDAAGNLKTRLDSRGVTATYSYDALNRPFSVVYSKSGATSMSVVWTYDQTGDGFSNGVGRLTSTLFPAAVSGYTLDANFVRTSTTYATGTTRYAYDPQGRLISAAQSVGTAGPGPFSLTVGYAYDAAGRITGITYPSGRRLSIPHVGGQPSAIALAKDGASTPQTLISQIQFDPFDGPKSWQWQLSAGVVTHERIRDEWGRQVRYRMGNTIRDLTYDAADRITGYTHYDATTGAAMPALNQTFGYDELGRLVSVTTGVATWAIGYDDNGNRTSVTRNGSVSSYTTASTSNRLLAVSNPTRNLGYDAAGNMLTDSGPNTNYTAVYDLTNRLSQIGSARIRTNISFVYDAGGQRVAKTSVPAYNCVPLPNGAGHQCSATSLSGGTLYVYDQQGQLLGEYSALTGQAVREYIWLGNTPVAMFTPGASTQDPPQVYYIHADHLDTPRVVVDQSDNLRWRWMAEPFGTTAPETNPQGLGPLAQPLRFPGQYEDVETGLFYNYFRDYDASVGRYTQSDPIGLYGGINTYAYVAGNPVNDVDEDGLKPRKKRPKRPERPDPAVDAAGYHDIKGEIICLEWNCPNSPDACSRNDAKNPTDFIPAAFNPAAGPKGCKCTRARYVTDWRLPNDPARERDRWEFQRDVADAFNRDREYQNFRGEFWRRAGDARQPLPIWHQIGVGVRPGR